MAKIYFSDYAIADGTTVAAVDNTTKASGWVNMADFDYVDFIISTTDADADTTVNAKVQCDTAGDGNAISDITGLAITQFTAAATAKLAVLRVRADQLAAGKPYSRVLVTAGNGTSGSVTSIVSLGFGHNYGAASDYDTAVVVQIKSI